MIARISEFTIQLKTSIDQIAGLVHRVAPQILAERGKETHETAGVSAGGSAGQASSAPSRRSHEGEARGLWL